MHLSFILVLLDCEFCLKNIPILSFQCREAGSMVHLSSLSRNSGIICSSVFPQCLARFYCSVTQSCPTLCNAMDCSMTGFPVFSPSPGACSNSCPLSQWGHPTTFSTVVPFSSCLQSFPASGFFWSRHLHIFLYAWLVWSPCCPRDTQESSPTPQFRSINSSVFSLLFDPTVTSIHDYWKNQSFD